MQFKKGPLAVDGIDLHVEHRRDLRLPRAERRRQVDDGPDADDAAAADRRQGHGRRLRHRHPRAARSAASIGAALQEAALDAHLTAREHMRLQTALQGVPKDERRTAATS